MTVQLGHDSLCPTLPELDPLSVLWDVACHFLNNCPELLSSHVELAHPSMISHKAVHACSFENGRKSSSMMNALCFNNKVSSQSSNHGKKLTKLRLLAKRTNPMKVPCTALHASKFSVLLLWSSAWHQQARKYLLQLNARKNLQWASNTDWEANVADLQSSIHEFLLSGAFVEVDRYTDKANYEVTASRHLIFIGLKIQETDTLAIGKWGNTQCAHPL